MSAVDYRRALHRIPELDNQLPETVQLVQRILAPLPCRGVLSHHRQRLRGSTQGRAMPWHFGRSWTRFR